MCLNLHKIIARLVLRAFRETNGENGAIKKVLCIMKTENETYRLKQNGN